MEQSKSDLQHPVTIDKVNRKKGNSCALFTRKNLKLKSNVAIWSVPRYCLHTWIKIKSQVFKICHVTWRAFYYQNQSYIIQILTCSLSNTFCVSTSMAHRSRYTVTKTPMVMNHTNVRGSSWFKSYRVSLGNLNTIM